MDCARRKQRKTAGLPGKFSKYLIPAIADIIKKLVFPLVGHYRQIFVDAFA